MMKQQIFSLTDPKFRDKIINLLQTTNGGHQNRNSTTTGNGYDKNSSSYDYQTNFQHQIYGSTSAATLQQLKKLLIDQAKDLKKCKTDLIEKDQEIKKLKEENESLKTRLERSEKRSSAQNSAPPQEIVETSVLSTTIKPKSSRRRKRQISPSLDSHETKKRSVIVPETPEIRQEIKPNSNRNDKNSVSDDSIATPRWRTLNYNLTLALEGTENITDDAFLKRHQKCEIEEKRIIRRDRMREREMELRRKLDSCQQKNALKSCEPIAGQPENLLEIEAIAFVKRLPNRTPRSKSKVELTGRKKATTSRKRRHK